VGLDKPETIMAKGYGAALALPVWVDIMDSASPQRYPAAQFKPPGPLQRIAICAVSSQLATAGCARANADYSMDLPASCIPADSCEIHRGGPLLDLARAPDRTRRPSSVPENIFRSFKKFFGGQ
jgi:penicillin-binding protein 1A